MKVVEVNNKPYLCLFALKDINVGEEILYDYGIKDLPWEVYIVFTICVHFVCIS